MGLQTLWMDKAMTEKREWMVDIVGTSTSEGFISKQIIVRQVTILGKEINQEEYEILLRKLKKAIESLIEFSLGDEIRR